MLRINPSTKIIVGVNLVKPSDLLIAVAQTASRIPESTSTIHAMLYPLASSLLYLVRRTRQGLELYFHYTKQKHHAFHIVFMLGGLMWRRCEL